MFRAFNLKIFRRELNRSSPTLTANCVAQSLLKIEPEWVAILIRLCFVATLMATTASGEKKPLHPLWLRRQTTKFNGVSYIVQRGAEALYSSEGKAQVRALIEHYLGNAAVLLEAANKAGWPTWGGVNAPYIWVKCLAGFSSWEMFDKMLHEANVVITPGAGFGAGGEGYFRISAFNSRANVEEVCRRLKSLVA